MISHLTESRRTGPGRLRHHRRGLPPVPRLDRTDPPDQRTAGRTRRRRRRRAGLRRAAIRTRLMIQAFPPDLEHEIRAAYQQLVRGGWRHRRRRSAPQRPLDDLPDASFAGQPETFLNIRGIDAVLTAVRGVFASLYNDRAIAYRVHHGFAHDDVALSAGIQRMVLALTSARRGSCSVSTLSPASTRRSSSRTPTASVRQWCRRRSTPTSSTCTSLRWLPTGPPSSSAVSDRRPPRWSTPTTRTVGRTTAFVDVDHVDRRALSLTDDEVTQLSRHAVAIETHYGRAMDIEWAMPEVTH